MKTSENYPLQYGTLYKTFFIYHLVFRLFFPPGEDTEEKITISIVSFLRRAGVGLTISRTAICTFLNANKFEYENQHRRKYYSFCQHHFFTCLFLFFAIFQAVVLPRSRYYLIYSELSLSAFTPCTVRSCLSQQVQSTNVALIFFFASRDANNLHQHCPTLRHIKIFQITFFVIRLARFYSRKNTNRYILSHNSRDRIDIFFPSWDWRFRTMKAFITNT